MPQRVWMRKSPIAGALVPRLRPNRLHDGSRGSVSVMFAVCLVPMIVAGAVAIDFSRVAAGRANLQEAVDNAALSGAAAYTADTPAAQQNATVMATSSFCNGTAAPWMPAGFTISGSGTTPCGSSSGAGATVTAQIQSGTPIVTVSARATMTTMIPAYFGGTITISATGVAANPFGGSYCVLATDAGSTGMSLSNGVTVNINQCGLAVNASGSNALSVDWGSTLNAQSVSVVGAVISHNNINPASGVLSNTTAMTDPYANTPVPAFGSCLPGTPYSLQGWQHPTMIPGVYCGVDMGGGGTVSMTAGVYYIKGGTFHVGGGVTVTGTGGVTIVLSGSAGNYATMQLDNGSNVTLTAPTSGATAGMVFFQDPKAPQSGVNNLAGGTSLNLTGALYFPSQKVIFSNGSSNSASCTQLVAWQVQFTGGATFNSNCGGVGTKGIGSSGVVSLIQ